MSNSDDCITTSTGNDRRPPSERAGSDPPDSGLRDAGDVADSSRRLAAGRPRTAALWRRLTAVAYDSILLAALFFVVTAVVVATHRSAVAAGAAWFQLLLVACGWLYFGWCWVHGGQTVGMRAWKLRVVDAVDPVRPVTWGRATVRYLFAFLPALPLAASAAGLPRSTAGILAACAYAAAYAAARLHPERACWHDIASGTRLESSR